MPWVETQPKGAANGNWANASCSADGTIVLVADSGGRLWRSTDSAVNWTEVRPAGNVNKDWSAVAVSATNGSVMLACVYGGRVYKSVNTGANWTEVQPAGAYNQDWACCCVDADGSVMLVGMAPYGELYVSTDTGANWTECTDTGFPVRFNGVACDSDGSVVLVACGYTGVWRSVNGGADWTEITADITATWQNYTSCAVDSDGSALLVATYGYTGGMVYYSSGGVGYEGENPGEPGRAYYSVNSGVDWSSGVTYTGLVGAALDSDGSVMMVARAGASGDCYESLNSGASWAASDTSTGSYKALALSSTGALRIAGIYGGRLYRFGSNLTLAPTSVVGYGAFGLPVLVFDPLQIGATSVVGYAAFGLPSVDLAGSPTVKIIYPEGTLDIPAVITSTTPTVQWVFTNTQVKFCLSSFDWTAGSINYTTGWVTSAARYHTLTSALTPGHTYSFQVLVQDDAAAVWSSDERSWCHINDATITAPVLTAEPDTDTKTAITLDWTAAVTTDSDTLTYEVEIITY